VQELLRHSSIKVTMDVYTQAVTATKRQAQSKVVLMIVPRQSMRQETTDLTEASPA
jgi:integrase